MQVQWFVAGYSPSEAKPLFAATSTGVYEYSMRMEQKASFNILWSND